MLGAGFTFFGGVGATVFEQFEQSNKKKINPLATQNTIVILLGGGIRWEHVGNGIENSVIQGQIRASMPNLFQPGNTSIRDLELLLNSKNQPKPNNKQSLNQKIVEIPFEKSGKLIQRVSNSTDHAAAIADVLGLQLFSDHRDSGNFNVAQDSPFYKRWIKGAAKKDKYYYHHDLPGNSRKIIGTTEDIDMELNQHLIQHATIQKTTADIALSEPLPMFKEALNYLKEFKPKLSILHPRLLDVAHSDFRQCLINMNRIDYSIAWLHSQLQAVNPTFSINTNWIILPEHGRDYVGNGRTDKIKMAGFDHNSSDAKNCFMIISGPKIKAATTVHDLNPFAAKVDKNEILTHNSDVFQAISSLTK